MKDLIPVERIEKKIYLIRGQKVMLDFDLADLYEVEVRSLNQAVKRNIERFPDDFMFQLTRQEIESLRSQFVILENSESGRGKYTKYLPYVFTEQGIAMLSSVLRSKRAIQVNITIMRTFVRLKQILSTHKDLAHKLKELEQRVTNHDLEIQAVFDAIRRMIEPPPTKKGKLGFL